jgi:hypothetical protein
MEGGLACRGRLRVRRGDRTSRQILKTKDIQKKAGSRNNYRGRLRVQIASRGDRTSREFLKTKDIQKQAGLSNNNPKEGEIDLSRRVRYVSYRLQIVTGRPRRRAATAANINRPWRGVGFVANRPQTVTGRI